MNDGKAAVRMDGLVKHRDGFRLGPINLMLAQGAVYALIGANGSGKSTLLRICRNLLKPDSGTLRILGLSYEAHDLEIGRQIAYVPEPLSGCEDFTLKELRHLIHRWYPGWDDRMYESLIRSFRLPVDKPVAKLSQGARKKAALTLALSSQARLLLLDEPANGLDFNSKRVYRETLASYMEQANRTVLLATNVVEDIHRLADYVLVLKNGRIQGPFEKDELQTSWRQIWIRSAGAVSWDEIGGVFDVKEGMMIHVVSMDARRTLADLERAGCEVIDEQPLPLEELLDYLTKEAMG
nr:ABC transporter [Bacillota bacterium]